MKNLFDTFAKNPTTNQLSAPYSSGQDKNIRVYRQFDDFFEENSMTSEQRNFFNTNIEELQAKICDYEDYVEKLKP